MKRSERSNGLDTALYKNYLYLDSTILCCGLLHLATRVFSPKYLDFVRLSGIDIGVWLYMGDTGTHFFYLSRRTSTLSEILLE